MSATYFRNPETVAINTATCMLRVVVLHVKIVHRTSFYKCSHTFSLSYTIAHDISMLY